MVKTYHGRFLIFFFFLNLNVILFVDLKKKVAAFRL